MGFFLINVELSLRGSLIPAAEGGKLPLSHYTRIWEIKVVITTLPSFQGTRVKGIGWL
jgi:hypothetical protein